MSQAALAEEYVDFELTGPQEEFFDSENEYTAAVAGFGSGKTEGALIKIFDNLERYPDINQAYLAPTYPLIRDIFYPKVSDFLDSLGVKHQINKSQHVIRIAGIKGLIYCRTMQDPESIVGWECGDAYYVL